MNNVKSFSRTITFLFLLNVILGCDDNSLPKYVEINSLRILNLQVSDGSNNAEFNPGDSVTVTPYISDINNSGNLSYEAKACVDPGVAYGLEPNCDLSVTLVNLGSGNITTLDVSSNFTGSANILTVVIPASEVIFAGKSVQDKFNGVSYLVTYKLISSDGRTLKGFKRILVSTNSVKNKNPQVSDVLSNEVVMTSLPTSQVGLSLKFAAAGVSSSIDSYNQMLSDGSFKNYNEELLTTWFISDGSLKYYRTVNADSNLYTGPSVQVSGRKSFIISVTRDGRGGSVVVKKEF